MNNIQSFWNTISEKFRRFAYDRVKQFDKPLELGNFITSILGLICLTVYHGFFLPNFASHITEIILYSVFGIKMFHLFARPSIEMQKVRFVRIHLLQYILVALLILNNLGGYLFDFYIVKELFYSLGFAYNTRSNLFIIEFYVVVVSIIDIFTYLKERNKVQLKATTLFLLSFIGLITVGALFLMLPTATTDGLGMRTIDAVFTSVSATCVTGLSVVDTGITFSFFGQCVLIALMQFGGIGILTFTSFFTIYLLKKASIREKLNVQDMISGEDFDDTTKLLRQIIQYTLITELIGAFCIFGFWNPDPTLSINQDLGQKIFFSIFHSVSAFNNAGFSLFSTGLMDPSVAFSPFVQISIMFLIIMGSMGFPIISNLFDRKQLRDRMANPWKKWEMGTQIGVYSTLILVVGGAFGFYILEQQHTLSQLNTNEAILASFFQSVTTRTAGFNTVDIGAMSIPTVLLFLALMYIGGNSGSTAGGIKTSTAWVLVLSAIATIRSKKDIEYSNRTINTGLVTRCFTIASFALSMIFLGTFALCITDPQIAFIDLLFEEISAYGTVGLSRNITPKISDAGKVVLILSMFLGRVGAITIALALASPEKRKLVHYPEANLMVG